MNFIQNLLKNAWKLVFFIEILIAAGATQASRYRTGSRSEQASFYKRAELRKKEAEGLKEAKAILAGAEGTHEESA